MTNFLSKIYSLKNVRLMENSPHSSWEWEQKMSFIQAYWTLLKPRVMGLVVFTALCGLIAAEATTGIYLHPFLKGMAVFSIAMGAGAAAVLNMWWERDIDCLMDRTKHRPLPKGTLTPAQALSFGTFLSFLSIVILGLSTNWWAANLLGFTIFYYIAIYTVYLKPKTPYNIVIGGVAGAIPPVIGWVANNGPWHSEPLLMFLVIWFWTMPHTWALCLFMYQDYAKANIPMMPAVKGVRSTKIHMLMYTLGMIIISFVGCELGLYTTVYTGGAIVLNSLFLYFQLRVLFSTHKKQAVYFFAYSIIYLFLLFILMVIGRVPYV